MQDQIPSPAPGHGEPPANATPAQDRSFEAFKKKIEAAINANKKKSEAAKKKKAADRFLVIQDLVKQLKRTQRYFGLRPHSNSVPMPDPAMSWSEQQVFFEENQKAAHKILEPLDVNKLPQFPVEKEPIIICIDIEAYERDHSVVTEVGLSTLDTLDLVDVAPGEGGANWMKQIRSRHFRIKGREHIVNKKFVIGHPDKFQFGESEFVELEEIGKVIDSCFQWPFSVGFKHDGHLKNEADNWDSAHGVNDVAKDLGQTTGQTTYHGDFFAPNKSAEGEQRGGRQRNLLILGHNLDTDLSYLSNLNSRVFSTPRAPAYPAPIIDPADADNPLHSIIEALDTANLYKVLTRESQSRSLTTIMADIGRTAWYAHCGGNDARYTLEALVGIVIKARLQEDEENTAKQAEADAAIKEAAKNDPRNNTPQTAKAFNLDGNASEEDTADPDVTSSTGFKEEPDEHNNNDAIEEQSNSTPPFTFPISSPPTAWKAEKARRLEARIAAVRREFEEESKAWETALEISSSTAPVTLTSSPPHANETSTAKNSDQEAITPFAKTLSDSQQAKAKKLTAGEKQREMTLRLNREDGMEGPVDWAVGGRDGWGK